MLMAKKKANQMRGALFFCCAQWIRRAQSEIRFSIDLTTDIPQHGAKVRDKRREKQMKKKKRDAVSSSRAGQMEREGKKKT